MADEDLSAITSNLARKLEYDASGLSAPDRNPSGGSLLESAGSAFGEFFLGARPSPGATGYRADHPVAGFLTEMAPTLVGGGAALKARQVLPAFDKAVVKFAEKGGNKITQGARAAVGTMAPVEAVRIAGTLAANPEQIGETMKESLFNLGVEAVGGGVLGALGAGGKVYAPHEPVMPVGSDLRSPNQLKIREMRDALPNIPADKQANYLGQISELESKVRLEQVGKKPFKFELANDGDGREVSRLFKDQSSPGGNLRRARLVRSGTDFADDVEKTRVIQASGLDGNWDAVQLPRYVGFADTADGKQLAKKIKHDIIDKARMTAADNNTFYSKTKDGMYVMARKITGDMAETKPSDEWVLWRTDQPGRFVPDVKDFADKIAARMAFLRNDNLKVDPKKPASIMDMTKTLVEQTPIREFRDLNAEYGMLKRGADKVAEGLGYKPGEGGSNFIVNRGKAVVEQYLTPKLYQFKDNPLAKYIIGHADRAFAQGKFISNKIVNGEALDEGAIKFSKIFGDPDKTGTYLGTRSVKAIIDDLSDADLHQMQEIADIVAGVDDPIKTLNELRASGTISEKLHQGLLDLDKLDGMVVDDLLNHQAAAGRNDFNPLKGHLMLSRVWEGDFRAPIVNESNDILYMAGGKTPQEADTLAQNIIKESGLNGVRHIPAEKFDALQELKTIGQIATKSKDYGVLSAANTRLRGKPVTFKERTGTEGYKKQFSRKEMLDRLSSHVNERYNYMARISADTALERELAQLRDMDPKAFAAVQDRLRQMEGKPGAIGQFINTATDKVLKPALGRNSATKISAIGNEYFYHTQLGMANALFPAMNAVTFMQTVLPEMAYVMNAADNRVMRDYYDVFLAGGSDMKPRGSVGALSPVKLLVKSFAKMKEGSKDELYGAMLNRAHREAVIDPQLLNEFIGQSSEMATKVKDVMSGDEPLWNLVRTWSGFLPAKSERFARGQAFTTGYLVGKDVMGMEGETLYQFARKFTERTMYNYATQDRATLMTGPLGRTFGLFKNWQTHYIHSMLQYAEEGVKYGNWAPLLWQMGGTASVGGIAALPIYGAADKISHMANDQSLMSNLYGAFGGTDPDAATGGLSDAVFMGLPMFLGVSLSGNVAAPGHDPSRDAAQLMSFPQWDRMKRLGQAVGGAIDNWATTGQHPITSPETRDQFIGALAPKLIARSAQVVGDAALRSLNTGNMVLKDMSPAERLMYGMGITPRRVGLAYEAADELWKDQNKRKNATSNYGRQWAEAQLEGDWEKLEELRQEVMVLGLDISSVTKSASSYKEKRSTQHIERTFSPESRKNLKELGLPGM